MVMENLEISTEPDTTVPPEVGTEPTTEKNSAVEEIVLPEPETEKQSGTDEAVEMTGAAVLSSESQEVVIDETETAEEDNVKEDDQSDGEPPPCELSFEAIKLENKMPRSMRSVSPAPIQAQIIPRDRRSKSISHLPKAVLRATRSSQNPEFAGRYRKFLDLVHKGLLDEMAAKEVGVAEVEEPDESEEESGEVEEVDEPLKRRLRDASLTRSTDDLHGAARKRLKADELDAEKADGDGKEPTQVSNGRDEYCWRCHQDGRVLHCETCARAYHLHCTPIATEVEGSWSCPECCLILHAENTHNRSRSMKSLTLDQLCNLLKYTVLQMKAVEGSEVFWRAVDPFEFPHYRDFVAHPMDLSTMERNIKRRQYGSTEAFLADAKWIQHNCVIFNTNQSRFTSVAKAVVKVAAQEMTQIEVCPDCYLNAHTRKDTWFMEVCRKPHLLVWAKLKGFPYWPAKVMRVREKLVDVRFFGAHDRAWVPVMSCYLYSKLIPAAPKKKANLEECVKEVEQHIKKLRDKYGSFEYAAFKTLYDPPREEYQLREMLPNYRMDGEEPSSKKGAKSLSPQRLLHAGAARKLMTTNTRMQPSSLLVKKPAHLVNNLRDDATQISCSNSPSHVGRSVTPKTLPRLSRSKFQRSEPNLKVYRNLKRDSPCMESEYQRKGSSKMRRTNSSVSVSESKRSDDVLLDSTDLSCTADNATHADGDEGMNSSQSLKTADAAMTDESLVITEAATSVVSGQAKNRPGPLRSKPGFVQRKSIEASSEPVVLVQNLCEDKLLAAAIQRGSIKTEKGSVTADSGNIEPDVVVVGSNMTGLGLIAASKKMVTSDDDIEICDLVENAEKFPDSERKQADMFSKNRLTGGGRDDESVMELISNSEPPQLGKSSTKQIDVIDLEQLEVIEDVYEEPLMPITYRRRPSKLIDIIDLEAVIGEKEDNTKRVELNHMDKDSTQPIEKVVLDSEECPLMIIDERGDLNSMSSSPGKGDQFVTLKGILGSSGGSEKSRRKGNNPAKISSRSDSGSTEGSKSMSPEKKRIVNDHIEDILDEVSGRFRRTGGEVMDVPGTTTIVIGSQEERPRPTLIQRSINVSKDISLSVVEQETSSCIDMESETENSVVVLESSRPRERARKSLPGPPPPSPTQSFHHIKIQNSYSLAPPPPPPSPPTPPQQQQRRRSGPLMEDDRTLPLRPPPTYHASTQATTSKPATQSSPSLLLNGPATPLFQHKPSPHQSKMAPQSRPITSTAHCGIFSAFFENCMQKVSDQVRSVMETFLRDLSQEGCQEATVRSLQIELERVKWQYRQEMQELKHNTDVTMMELQSMCDAEKQRLRQEMRQQLDLEIMETKHKQWCAMCHKEAMFYCCWNTSYCNHSCQGAHWPAHMSVCTQATSTSGAVGGGGGQSSSESGSTQVTVARTVQSSGRQQPQTSYLIQQNHQKTPVTMKLKPYVPLNVPTPTTNHQPPSQPKGTAKPYHQLQTVSSMRQIMPNVGTLDVSQSHKRASSSAVNMFYF